MANTVKNTIATRRVAILAADGVDEASLSRVMKSLTAAGAQGKIVAPRLGNLKASQGKEFLIEFSFLTASSVLFDAVYVPGGAKSVEALVAERDALEFVTEAYRHCKTIAATGEGVDLLRACPELPARNGDGKEGDPGIVEGPTAQNGRVIGQFIEAMAQHRHWVRQVEPGLTPAVPGKKKRERAASI